MLVKRLQLSNKNFFDEFHKWVREHNKKSLLYIQSIYSIGKINDLLGVHKSVSTSKRDSISFVSEDLKIRISYELVRKPDGNTSYLLTSYHNANNNTVYLVPDILQLDVIHWLQFTFV